MTKTIAQERDARMIRAGIRFDRQIYDAGVRHHDCCHSLTEVFEHDHTEANWLNGQPRDVVREQRVTVDGESYRVRITDTSEVWTYGAEWKLCGRIDWADGIEATIRNASEIVEAYVRAAAANDTTGK